MKRFLLVSIACPPDTSIIWTPFVAALCLLSSAFGCLSQDTEFQIGDKVWNCGPLRLNVRSSPAGAIVDDRAIGATATILGGPVDAFLASDNMLVTWYQLRWDDGRSGWSSASYLLPVGMTTRRAKPSREAAANQGFAVPKTPPPQRQSSGVTKGPDTKPEGFVMPQFDQTLDDLLAADPAYLLKRQLNEARQNPAPVTRGASGQPPVKLEPAPSLDAPARQELAQLERRPDFDSLSYWVDASKQVTKDLVDAMKTESQTRRWTSWPETWSKDNTLSYAADKARSFMEISRSEVRKIVTHDANWGDALQESLRKLTVEGLYDGLSKQMNKLPEEQEYVGRTWLLFQQVTDAIVTKNPRLLSRAWGDYLDKTVFDMDSIVGKSADR